MKAMILAAGIGRRLGPIAREVPKPLIQVGGRPILDDTIARCRAAGIEEVVINLHHRPEAFRGRYGDGKRWGLRIRWSVEERLLGTAGALARAEELLGERFLVVYGDNVFRCDFGRIVSEHLRSAATATLGVYVRTGVAQSGVVQIAGGRVVGFIEKPLDVAPGAQSVFAGIAMLESAVLDLLPRGIPSDVGRDLIPALLQRGDPVSAFELAPGELHWIDTPEDLQRTRDALGAHG